VPDTSAHRSTFSISTFFMASPPVAAVPAAVNDLLARGYGRALAGRGTKSAPRGGRRHDIVWT